MVRVISIAALTVFCVIGAAGAAPDATYTSDKVQANAAYWAFARSKYQSYVKEQADTLVAMTRVLAKSIEHGDLDAAQSTYAPAHRYFKRIEPLARTLHGLETTMDARADVYEAKDADPNFSGFHRLEHGLFARRSTAGLTNYADQLHKDAGAFRQRSMLLEIMPDALLDETAKLVKDIADRRLDGREERFSRTDLWDVEANIDGVRQIVSLVQSRLQGEVQTFERMDTQFAVINSLLEKHKAGCGFKNYDEVADEDKAALKNAVSALAAELSALHRALAMN